MKNATAVARRMSARIRLACFGDVSGITGSVSWLEWMVGVSVSGHGKREGERPAGMQLLNLQNLIALRFCHVLLLFLGKGLYVVVCIDL